jgi:hypothetical protein
MLTSTFTEIEGNAVEKWDYLMLSLVKSYGINYRVNGEKVADWKDLPLHDIFNVIGKQGFEFVAYDGENYIFKRPTAPAARPVQPLRPSTQSDT